MAPAGGFRLKAEQPPVRLEADVLVSRQEIAVGGVGDRHLPAVPVVDHGQVALDLNAHLSVGMATHQVGRHRQGGGRMLEPGGHIHIGGFDAAASEPGQGKQLGLLGVAFGAAKGGGKVVLVAEFVGQEIGCIRKNPQLVGEETGQVFGPFGPNEHAQITGRWQHKVFIGHDVDGHATGVDGVALEAIGVDLTHSELGRHGFGCGHRLFGVAVEHPLVQPLAQGRDGLVDLIDLLQVIKTLRIGLEHLFQQQPGFGEAGVQPEQVAQLGGQHDHRGLVRGVDVQFGKVIELGQVKSPCLDLVARRRDAAQQQNPVAFGQRARFRAHPHFVATLQSVDLKNGQTLFAPLDLDVQRRAMVNRAVGLCAGPQAARQQAGHKCAGKAGGQIQVRTPCRSAGGGPRSLSVSPGGPWA